MARRNRPADEVVPASEEVVSEVSEEAEEVTGSNQVTVTFNGGSRVYSKDVHGKNYKDLAKEFVAKHGGTIK